MLICLWLFLAAVAELSSCIVVTETVGRKT